MPVRLPDREDRVCRTSRRTVSRHPDLRLRGRTVKVRVRPVSAGFGAATREAANALDAQFHFLTRRRVRGVDSDLGWLETPGCDRLLDPQDHVVARATFVIAEVVIQADRGHLAPFKKSDGLFRPPHRNPPRRRGSLIVEVHLHAAVRAFTAIAVSHIHGA